mmetsp:Transcript_103899/g.189237  ORF Transcript_103899/g.189237 Transcript_103899/m.189237 type:complete len:253 (-) Transcript_103899:951-1709(-)
MPKRYLCCCVRSFKGFNGFNEGWLRGTQAGPSRLPRLDQFSRFHPIPLVAIVPVQYESAIAIVLTDGCRVPCAIFILCQHMVSHAELLWMRAALLLISNHGDRLRGGFGSSDLFSRGVRLRPFVLLQLASRHRAWLHIGSAGCRVLGCAFNFGSATLFGGRHLGPQFCGLHLSHWTRGCRTLHRGCRTLHLTLDIHSHPGIALKVDKEALMTMPLRFRFGWCCFGWCRLNWCRFGWCCLFCWSCLSRRCFFS